jgi:hypothetical protein
MDKICQFLKARLKNFNSSLSKKNFPKKLISRHNINPTTQDRNTKVKFVLRILLIYKYYTKKDPDPKPNDKYDPDPKKSFRIHNTGYSVPCTAQKFR